VVLAQVPGTEPESFGYAGAHSLGEHVGAGRQAPGDLQSGRGLQVDRDAPLPSGPGIGVERQTG
jgi:hypothetical protein